MKKFFLICLAIFLFGNVWSQERGNSANERWVTIITFDSCSFSLPCNTVYIDSVPDNIWQVGVPQKTVFNSTQIGDKAIVTDTIHSYPQNNFSSFILNLDEIYDNNYNLEISFTHRFDTDTLKDGGYLEISYDSGQTWYNIIEPYYDYSQNPNISFPSTWAQNFYNFQDSLIDGKIGFSGSSDGWIKSELNIVWYSAIKESSIPLSAWVRFNFISDSVDTGKDGWMIDELVVKKRIGPGSTNNNYQDLIKVDVYPNPVNEKTTISIDADITEPFSLSVFNTLGQEVKTFSNLNSNKIELNTNELSGGIYLIQLYNQKAVLARKKLVVKHN